MPITKQKQSFLSSLAVQHGLTVVPTESTPPLRLPADAHSACRGPRHGAHGTEPVLAPRCLLPPHPGRLTPQLAAFLEQLRTVLAVLHQAKSVMLA